MEQMTGVSRHQVRLAGQALLITEIAGPTQRNQHALVSQIVSGTQGQARAQMLHTATTKAVVIPHLPARLANTGAAARV